MISALLDIVAPRARARIEVDLSINFDDFVSFIESENTLIEKKKQNHKFRVKGDFSSDMKATGVVLGNKANPKHYGNIGFYLNIEKSKDARIILKAEERVILGYLEVMAVSSALEKMLRDLIEKYHAKET
jgi:hypothetical protein